MASRSEAMTRYYCICSSVKSSRTRKPISSGFAIGNFAMETLSKRGAMREIHGGAADKDGENSIWLQRGQTIRFVSGEGTEVIEIRSGEE